MKPLTQKIWDRFEIHFWHIAIWLVKDGYGADCPDVAEGCASCEAKKAIEWMEEHIKILQMF